MVKRTKSEGVDHLCVGEYIVDSDEKEIIKLLNNPKGLIKKYNADEWKGGRHFIAEAIDKPGVILDPAIGSAAMIYSLSRWSGHKLIPLGIDANKKAINLAQQLYPQYKDNFIYNDFNNYKVQLPICDYVYWSIFTNFNTDNIGLESWTLKIIPAIGRRFIISFYNDFTVDGYMNVVNNISNLLGSDFKKAVKLKGERTIGYEAFYFDRN